MHQRSWSSESTVPAASGEFFEVTLDLQEDDRVLLRSINPATPPTTTTTIEINQDEDTPESSTSRSSTLKRNVSRKLLQFSQELKAEFMKKLSWNHSNGPKELLSSSSLNHQKTRMMGTEFYRHGFINLFRSP